MTPPESAQIKSRRPHRKSRRGCAVCKKRRIKCDERHPQCGNCVVTHRVCSYLEQSAGNGSGASTGAVTAAPRSSGASPGPSLSSGAGEGGRRSAGPIDLGAVFDAPGGGPTFTVIHMALLHHAEVNMAEYMALQGVIRPIIDAAIHNAVTAPYLLDQLLALSALHLSTQDLTKASNYRQQATELQTRALGMFNQIREDISECNYMPTFLFATLLGIHVLRETLADHHLALSDFVGAFVGYARLHRGVRAVTNVYWESIVHSDLKPLLYITNWTDLAENRTPGLETADLKGFLESSDLAPSSIKACIGALDWVQWVIDMIAMEPSRFDLAVHATMAWPLMIPDEYIDGVYQHRPEALVVLAYYAAILHQHRRYWVFGNAGSSLIQFITLHVGGFWADVLTWPQNVISSERSLSE
ncbi:Upc2 protein [Ilyonectria robusta]|uniref:Upc2 protein n=1 Tax=Ilyonectria robusta TaxID=1079257 RepID=UPI001E8D43C4|nr:Upc2 protein [Ilyonectria robusta]KAH8686346.1 Upc2 protein [Ilyonectria robusta]